MTDLKIAPGFVLPLDVVTEAIGIVATRGAGKSFTSAVVLEEAYAAGVPFVVIDPNGVYWGLRSNAKGDGPGLPVYVLGGQRGDLPLEPTAGKLVANLVVDSGHSFVLDLSDMPTKNAARTFVAAFLDHLHRRKSRARTTLLLVVDEADEFAPQNPRGETARSLGAMETIAKRGRAWGLGIVMITQRTQALNKDVLDLIETLIVMRQLSERSRGAVKGWIADKDLRDELGVMESLQSLPTGTAWVWSPLREMLERVQVRRIRTFDSYATPKPGETRVEPSSRSELDLDALGEEMRATVERAKENDPKELRLMNAALQRRVAEAESSIERLQRDSEVAQARVERVVEKIEVPVFSEATIEALNEVVRNLTGVSRDVAAAAESIESAVRDVAAKLVQRVREVEPPPRAAPPAKPAAAARPVRTPQPAANGDVVLNRKAERMVLAVLAQYPEGRTKRQTAILAGYASKGGGFNGALSKLRTAGLIIGSDPIQITDAGFAAIDGQYEPLPVGRALLDHWLSTLNRAAERAVLQVLYDTNGEALDKQTLADRAGYEAAGGGFNGALSKLRTLELIEGSRELRISETLL